MNVTITNTYTRNSIADEICGTFVKLNMFIFGGYVRDKYILNLDHFHDIDIVYFSHEISEIKNILRFAGYFFKEKYTNNHYYIQFDLKAILISRKL